MIDPTDEQRRVLTTALEDFGRRRRDLAAEASHAGEDTAAAALRREAEVAEELLDELDALGVDEGQDDDQEQTEPQYQQVQVPEARANWQVWEVCVGLEPVATVERADEHGYVVACWDSDEPGDRFGLSRKKCWDGPEPYESVQAAVDAFTDHRYAAHVPPDEQHLDEVYSLVPQGSEAARARDQLRRAMAEEADPDQP